jgi:hypothetical protein
MKKSRFSDSQIVAFIFRGDYREQGREGSPYPG